MSRRLLKLCALAGPFLLATAGCSEQDFSRQPIAGYVFLDGRPLPLGAIMIYPTKIFEKGDSISGGAMIKDGYFSLPRASGLPPGDYNVSIRAAEAGNRPRDDRGDGVNIGPIAEEKIPAKYNSETILVIKVTDRAIKEVTFHIDSH